MAFDPRSAITIGSSILVLALVGCPDGDDDDVADDDVADDDTGDDDTAADDLWVAVSAGIQHTCGLRASGIVECWGLVDQGITEVPDGIFTQVSDGGDHACALDTDGGLSCWGCYQEDGIAACSAPDGTFSQVGSGATHSCAVSSAGEVRCWGDDEDGQATAGPGQFVEVAAGETFSCGRLSDGDIDCWGDSPFSDEELPVTGDYVQISAGDAALCALRADAEIDCWSRSGIDWVASEPEGSFTQVTVGYRNSCAIGLDGLVQCWGYDAEDTHIPPAVPFQQINAGAWHTCGVTLEGEIECWGSDTHGESSQGTGTNAEYEVPDASGEIRSEAEPNDAPYPDGDTPPFEQANDCTGLVSGDGYADRIEGALQTVEPESYYGDTDAFHLVAGTDGYLVASLDWPSAYDDLDWVLYCYYGSEYNPWQWWIMTDGSTFGLTKPAQAATVLPIDAGTECYVWIVGYDAPDGTPYTMDLWMESTS